jgi:flagellum-specific peptidoglycan hydrolase FlgJ
MTTNPSATRFAQKSRKQSTTLNTLKEEIRCQEYYDYIAAADLVLSTKNTKMTGKMLADAWYETLVNFDIDVPVTLALAQAYLESSFCNSKLSKQKNNPYSLKSGKSYASYSSLELGVSSYYKVIAKRYLQCKTIDELLKNFSTCEGYRYAGSKNYEYILKNQIQSYDIILAENK